MCSGRVVGRRSQLAALALASWALGLFADELHTSHAERQQCMTLMKSLDGPWHCMSDAKQSDCLPVASSSLPIYPSFLPVTRVMSGAKQSEARRVPNFCLFPSVATLIVW